MSIFPGNLSICYQHLVPIVQLVKSIYCVLGLQVLFDVFHRCRWILKPLLLTGSIGNVEHRGELDTELDILAVPQQTFSFGKCRSLLRYRRRVVWEDAHTPVVQSQRRRAGHIAEDLIPFHQVMEFVHDDSGWAPVVSTSGAAVRCIQGCGKVKTP